MKVVFGLGNPGSNYLLTRHNIGYMVLDHIANFFSLEFSKANKLYLLANFLHKNEKIFLVKPLTYMNLSGVAVRYIVDFYKLELKDILVICDDINLKFGQIKINEKGSDGGHNGLASIINELNEINFPRLRIGIGNNFPKGQQADYVLSPFNSDEREKLPEILNFAKEITINFIEGGYKSASDFYSKTMKEIKKQNKSNEKA